MLSKRTPLTLRSNGFRHASVVISYITVLHVTILDYWLAAQAARMSAFTSNSNCGYVVE